MVYHIYIMASASGVLYTGVTSQLETRVVQHKQKFFAGFSAKYNTTKLVYFEPFSDVREAIAREKQRKRWRREKKVFLIERANPTWRDLSADFPHSPASSPKSVIIPSVVEGPLFLSICHPDRNLSAFRSVGENDQPPARLFSFRRGWLGFLDHPDSKTKLAALDSDPLRRSRT